MPRRGRYSREDLIRSDDLPFTPGRMVRLPARFDNQVEKEVWMSHLADPSIPKILDLFCGAGGLSEGFVSAGFTVAAALDHDVDACQTYAANLPARVIHTDIAAIADPTMILEDLPVTAIDAIVGGPPCQGFSVVGRARISTLDKENKLVLLARNELYQHFFRFIEAFHPAFFIMENVPTLLTYKEEAYIKAIQQECERLRYALTYKVIDAADYGVPQVRRRLFLIGSRLGWLFRWPRPISEGKPVPLQDAIGDLPKVLPPSLEEILPYYPDSPLSDYQRFMRSHVDPDNKHVIYDHVVRPVREDDKQVFLQMKPGDRYSDIDPRFQRYNPETFRDKYYMLKPDAPGVTITAHLAKDGYRYIHWDREQHRTISVREAARIQSFGDHFRFAGSRSARFRQIGNAVPPLLAEQLGEQVRLALRRRMGELGPVQLGLPGYEHLSKLAVSSQ